MLHEFTVSQYGLSPVSFEVRKGYKESMFVSLVSYFLRSAGDGHPTFGLMACQIATSLSMLL